MSEEVITNPEPEEVIEEIKRLSKIGIEISSKAQQKHKGVRSKIDTEEFNTMWNTLDLQKLIHENVASDGRTMNSSIEPGGEAHYEEAKMNLLISHKLIENIEDYIGNWNKPN